MEKIRAVDLLKQALAELPRLKGLHYDNQEFKLWRARVETIIKEGLAGDYDNFDFVQTKYFLDDIGIESLEQSLDYPKKLKDYETALKSIIQKYEILGIEEKLQGVNMEHPKVFIAHGGKSGALDKLCDFLTNLGVQPLVVEELPTKGMFVDDKVKKYQQEADCAIILATGGGIIEEKTGKQHPRLNVIDELARLRVVFPKKTILLLEQKIELPSNVSGIAYERFTRQSMDRVFIAIARELKEFGILKAVKPQNGASSSSGDIAPSITLP